jgi:transposase-like protein
MAFIFRKPTEGSIPELPACPARGAHSSEWRYLYRAVDKHGTPIDFLLSASRDLAAAKRVFRKSSKDCPLLSPGKIGTDGANVYPAAIADSVAEGLLYPGVIHRVSKHPQQMIESDHFRIKQMTPKVGGFRSFATARRTIAGFERCCHVGKRRLEITTAFTDYVITVEPPPSEVGK